MAGRDGAAFYDYVLQVYSNPPVATMFLHGHGGNSVHTRCETMFTRSHMFYQSLANNAVIGLSSHMMTLTDQSGGRAGERAYQIREGVPTLSWEEGMYQQNTHELPICHSILKKWNVSTDFESSFYSCCGSFIVPANRFHMHPRSFYAVLRAHLMDAALDDEFPGRFCFEYVIFHIFTEPPLTAEMEAWYELSYSLDLDLPERMNDCRNTTITC